VAFIRSTTFWSKTRSLGLLCCLHDPAVFGGRVLRKTVEHRRTDGTGCVRPPRDDKFGEVHSLHVHKGKNGKVVPVLN
jgi:hypothetical protein